MSNRPTVSEPTVVVPVKAFSAAKARLAGALDDGRRAALARAMADRVVTAARGLPVVVVCDDEAVAAWARARGATVVWQPGAGLNPAVSAAVEWCAERDVAEVVVAHADLPFADDLRTLAGFAGVTLVPDRHRDGTNVLALPAAAGFRFAYGPGSFARHRAEAERLGLAVRVLDDTALSWDVDHPEDLRGLPAEWPAVATAEAPTPDRHRPDDHRPNRRGG